ncbi:MAG TPA: hypothetical protein ENN80_00310, partial [Candidatus Hydrogenedentes bacterium]|nr:hypothetical protein [Candidatus Hydrogenedentota bacterium]
MVFVLALAAIETDPVEAVLETDRALNAHHHGYLDYLARHPDLAVAEEAYIQCRALVQFSYVVDAFDDLLAADFDAQQCFDRYYDALAADQWLRFDVDAVYRLESEQRGARAVVTPALEFLRASPYRAIEFLRHVPRFAQGPRELAAFYDMLKKNPQLQRDLCDRFIALNRRPEAVTRVYPWWKAVVEEGPLSNAHGPMHTYFMDHPHHFWVWHRRQIALAADAHARAWIRYWRRLARRTPGLGRSYDRWLQRLCENGAFSAPPDDVEKPSWPP